MTSADDTLRTLQKSVVFSCEYTIDAIGNMLCYFPCQLISQLLSLIKLNIN